ncbi:hypothetical protein GCM10023156_02440 [Novipirellula rosea]|uniref:Uncharacterized protein n=1 Tax=Novipirellula rosea TaxID=1031540 RepID=A0ABP8M7P9_9BACT
MHPTSARSLAVLILKHDWATISGHRSVTPDSGRHETVVYRLQNVPQATDIPWIAPIIIAAGS